MIPFPFLPYALSPYLHFIIISASSKSRLHVPRPFLAIHAATSILYEEESYSSQCFYHILYPRFMWHFQTCASCISITFTPLPSLVLFPHPLIYFLFPTCPISCIFLFILHALWPNEFIYSCLWKTRSFYTPTLALQLEELTPTHTNDFWSVFRPD